MSSFDLYPQTSWDLNSPQLWHPQASWDLCPHQYWANMPSSILVAVSLISVGYHHSNISGPHATFNMCKTNLTPNKPTTLAQLNFGTQSLSVATYLNVYVNNRNLGLISAVILDF